MKSHIQVSSPDLRLKKEDESIKEFTLNKVKELEELFENKSDVISSLILEPLVQCASGMGIYNKLYLKEARSCLLYTSPSPRDLSTSRMPSSA